MRLWPRASGRSAEPTLRSLADRIRVERARATLRNAYQSYVDQVARTLSERIVMGDIRTSDELEEAMQAAVAAGPYVRDVDGRFDAVAFTEHRDAARRLTGLPALPDGTTDWKAVAAFAIDEDLRHALTARLAHVEVPALPPMVAPTPRLR